MIEATNAGEWKVRIERPYWGDRLDIWIWRLNGRDADVMQPDGLIYSVSEGASVDHIKPSLTLSGFDAKQMLHALAEALAEEGIKTPDSQLLKGTLEAQTAHLNDLRTLLKLNKTKTSGESK